MQQPHAVIALPNNIEIDARAHRNGLALLAAGYRVTMVGYGTGIPHSGVIAGMPYRLCQAKVEARSAGPKPPTPLYRVVRKVFHVTMKRKPPQKVQKAVAQVEETVAGAGRKGRAAIRKLATKVGDLRLRRGKAADPEGPFDWRTALPHVPVMIEAMRDTVAGLRPDLIVTDVHLLPLGAEIADLMAAEGRRMGLIYDAREYVYGLASEDPRITRGFPALEAEFIGRCDATVTVCEPIADFLQQRYGLPEVPPLVSNAPIAELPHTGRPMTVRDLIDVGDAPLLVYAGGLSYHRGVHDVVVALADLPDVHLAVGARRESSYTNELEQIAERHGVRDRLHFVPFAPTHEVAEYLASGTAAIIPFLPVGNHNWAAPNKYFESVQARLPILTSNMEWLSERVTRLGIGEVFEHSNPAAIVAAVTVLLGDLDSYRAKLTDELVAEHTFEHFEPVIQDVARRVTDPAALTGLAPGALTDHLAAIRTDMLHQRVPLADSALFEPRPWIRIGSTNTGGLPQLWADALMRRHPAVIAESVWRHRDQNLTFPVGETITYPEWISPAWQRKLAAKIEQRVTHVLTESGRGVVGALLGTWFYEETAWFESIGVVQGLVFHGSDIRNPRVHAQLEADSPFRDPSDEMTATLQKQVDDLTPHVTGFTGPKFVTTMDLLDYVPDATWLPVVVDTHAWASTTLPFAHGGPPVVFHVPSRRAMKGSDDVDRVCRELAEAGVIDYVSGLDLSRDEMRSRMLAADVVIDQIRLGDYGITAVEGMSGGRVVLGHVADRVRVRLPAPVPILEADAANLRGVIEGLIADPAAAARLSQQGRDYVLAWHDGTHASLVLSDFMGI